jgi:glycosyltransferase involved in cell wall biosynthesis
VKILIVTNYLPPKIGGIERFTHELASALNDLAGIDVSVASASWPLDSIDRSGKETQYSYKVIFFSSMTMFRRLPIPNLLRKSFWRSIQSLDGDYDLVFFQSHLFILNWIIAIKLRRIKRRIWMNHGCNYVPMNSRFGRFSSYFYERIGMALLKKFCNEFVAQSRNAADWISSKVGQPFLVLSNAIKLDNVNEPTDVRDHAKRINVLFVGRFVQGKGLVECISAVSKANVILESESEPIFFKLTIVGSGPLVNQIPGDESNVTIDYRGELSHSEVISAMYESEVLIQAYTQPEGLTTVTLEGLATGMLIVTTPISGGEDLDLCSNYMPGNLNELPSLLLKSRQRSESRSDLIASGRRFIETGLTWDTIAQQLINREYSRF